MTKAEERAYLLSPRRSRIDEFIAYRVALPEHLARRVEDSEEGDLKARRITAGHFWIVNAHGIRLEVVRVKYRGERATWAVVHSYERDPLTLVLRESLADAVLTVNRVTPEAVAAMRGQPRPQPPPPGLDTPARRFVVRIFREDTHGLVAYRETTREGSVQDFVDRMFRGPDGASLYAAVQTFVEVAVDAHTPGKWLSPDEHRMAVLRRHTERG